MVPEGGIRIRNPWNPSVNPELQGESENLARVSCSWRFLSALDRIGNLSAPVRVHHKIHSGSQGECDATFVSSEMQNKEKLAVPLYIGSRTEAFSMLPPFSTGQFVQHLESLPIENFHRYPIKNHNIIGTYKIHDIR